MVFRILLGFSLLYITIGMVTANPGVCPIYPRVSRGDKTCRVEKNCTKDTDCKPTQKCCENPCGVALCSDNITPDPLAKIEKCPIPKDEPSTCTRRKTKFCYIRVAIPKCKRCCIHETSCNPAPQLLTEAKNCHPEICENFKCPQQGSVCRVDETSNKPLCQCIAWCNRTGNYVCASHGDVPRTFSNRCYMNKYACEKKTSYRLEHEGRCIPPTKKVLPVEKPMVKDPVRYIPLSRSAIISCIGDRELVQLSWYQQRTDGTEIEIDKALQSNKGSYAVEGRVRRVQVLSITSVGPGSYGVYKCKQKYNNVVMETTLHIKPQSEVIFNRRKCNSTKDKGSCNGNFPNYYFDHHERRCRRFNYTGCDGNENNFQSLKDCRVKCAGMKPVNTSTALTTFGYQCGRHECNYYENCWKGQCHCEDKCSFMPSPVCASNGKTFISLCAMKVHACRWRKRLVAVYVGKCGPFKTTFAKRRKFEKSSTTTPKPPLSLCALKRCPPYATCKINPFSRMPQCHCHQACPFTPKIICASNRRHYLNECFMQYNGCKQKRKLTVLKQGLCIFNQIRR